MWLVWPATDQPNEKKWKVEWETQTSTFENSCGRTALDMPERRETAEQIDWRAKQPSQVVCFSGDLRCWEAWDTKDLRCWEARDTTCGYKARDITPEEALHDLPWKDERGPSSDEHWNRFKANVGEASGRPGWAHMGFSERINTILTWTELNWRCDWYGPLQTNLTSGLECVFSCKPVTCLFW